MNRELKAEGCSVRVGMEATGHARWFERLLVEPGSSCGIGDPTQIKAKTGAKAEDGPPGCCTAAAIAAGGSLSSGVGTQCGKSGSGSAAVALASGGADADADHEAVAGHLAMQRERRIVKGARRKDVSLAPASNGYA